MLKVFSFEVSKCLRRIPVTIPYRPLRGDLDDGFGVVRPGDGDGCGADRTVGTDGDVVTLANRYFSPYFQRKKGRPNTIRGRTVNDPAAPVVVNVHASLVFVPNSDVPSIQ